MTEYEKKCKTCKHNYKENDDEPRCNYMCENHEYYESTTNHEHITAYIESKALFEALKNVMSPSVFAYVCNEVIDHIPNADVAPVKYGQWMECDYKKLEHGFVETYPNKGIYCSLCRAGFKKDELMVRNFCPSCGADMGCEKEEE